MLNMTDGGLAASSLRAHQPRPIPSACVCSVVDVRVGTTEEQTNVAHYRFGPTRFSVIPKAAVRRCLRARAGGSSSLLLSSALPFMPAHGMMLGMHASCFPPCAGTACPLTPPAAASPQVGKVSVRFVPDQEPGALVELLTAHIRHEFAKLRSPNTCSVAVRGQLRGCICGGAAPRGDAMTLP